MYRPAAFAVGPMPLGHAASPPRSDFIGRASSGGYAGSKSKERILFDIRERVLGGGDVAQA